MKRSVLVVMLMLTALVTVPGQSALAAACRPTLTKLGLSGSTVVGGGPVTATVTLSCKVTKAVTVRVAGFKGVTVPPTVRVTKNRKTATFTVRTAVTPTVRRGTIVASLGKVRRSARLTVTPRPKPCRPALTGFTAPGLMHAGDRVMARVTLSCAPNVDVKVAMSTDRPTLEVPSSVTVPRGRSTVHVPVTAKLVWGEQYRARITASHGGRSLPRDITVNPGLKSVDIPPSSDPNGVSVMPLFTGPAPAGGLTVKVASDNPAVTVPPTQTYPQGAYGGDVWDVRVHPVTKNTKVTISVTLGTRTLTASKVLLPPFDGTQRVSLLAGESGDLYGLQYSQDYHVLLSNPAPPGGLQVEMKVQGDTSAVRLDSVTEYISEGNTAAYFRLDTADVTRTSRVELVATVLGRTVSLPLTIHPRITAVTMPESVKSGTTFQGTITLAGPSDVDTTVWLSPSWGILHPQRSVTIPAGATTATFEATSSPVDEPSEVYVTATLGRTDLSSTRTTLLP